MQLSKKQMEEIRGRKIAMIFQDALSSLNPVFTIGSQMIEAIRVHHKISKKEAKQQAIGILKKVGISEPEKRMKQYTHELSGGMRQRVMIAIALCCSPQVLIADEPTTALDVTIQAQIMDLIAEIKEREQMGVILITHDMAVVAENCDRVAVMYLGQVVEEASVDEIFAHPMHPYTKGLMKSIPRMTGDREKDLYMIEGTLPVLDEIKEGCRFASRCPYANEKCKEQEAEFKEVSKEHYVRCFYPQTSEGDLKHE